MNSNPGELPGDKIARIVGMYIGCSLLSRRSELGALVGRGVDDPAEAVKVTTNCGMFAMGVFNRAGVRHPRMDERYLNPPHGLAIGKDGRAANAIAWLREVGRDKGALIKYSSKGPQPKVGSLLRYNTAGKNDDHVEFLMSPLDSLGYAAHAGGGRTDNAITLVARSMVLKSAGRPLVEFWDPDMLGIEYVAPGSDVNSPGAYPDKEGEL